MQAASCSMEASSSSSSRSPPQHKYDVFLSFHGKDTRKSFTDHLYAALVLRGIVTFKDDINLNRGENIKYGLPKAIEESRISLVVFSKSYAESEWCLEELVKVMECSKRSHQHHIVLPIFYDVQPSEVRAQKGSVADSLAKHHNCGPKVEKWKETLHEFANLSGYVIEDLFSGHEAKNIQKIVKSLDIDEKYQLEKLNERQSTELFSWHAFKQDHPKEDYMKLSNEVVSYLDGIPLALEVIGSFLFMRTKSQWRSAIIELKTIPNNEVQEKLKISFDSLSDKRKELFLDIACFFVGRNKDFTMEILEGCDFHPEIGIQELIERCLLKYDQFNKIIMHNLLRDMGREIIRQESIKEPGKRSRLWLHKDALEVLTEGTGTRKVEGLFLDFPEPRDVQVNEKAFKKMGGLRLLNLNYVQLTVGYEHIISRRLVLLCWKSFPLDCMPSNLYMENLVYLDLSYSSLKYVWNGTKILDKLKFLHLNHCSSLIETPDFSGLTNLVELSLNDCTSLVEVGESISYLNKIVNLDMKNCKKLEKLPFGIWMMKSLESLDLSHCPSLRNFAGFKGSPSTLLYSFFSSWILPKGKVGSVDLQVAKSRLKRLSMVGCNLSYMPNEIGYLTSLEDLNISRNNFSTLPDSMGDLRQLKTLSVSGCRRLQSVLKLPPSLSIMQAFGCKSLESISMESNWQNKYGTRVLCYGSPKLAENNFVDRCIKGLLQCKETSAIGGPFDIYLTGGEVPNWFEYRSTGPYLSFVASTKILGWITCATFAFPKGVDSTVPPACYFWKNSSVCGRPRLPCHLLGGADKMIDRNMNVMWFSYVPLSTIKMRVKCGDEVKIWLQTDTQLGEFVKCFQLIEWGISLIPKDENQEEEEDDDGKEEKREEEEMLMEDSEIDNTSIMDTDCWQECEEELDGLLEKDKEMEEDEDEEDKEGEEDEVEVDWGEESEGEEEEEEDEVGQGKLKLP